MSTDIPQTETPEVQDPTTSSEVSTDTVQVDQNSPADAGQRFGGRGGNNAGKRNFRSNNNNRGPRPEKVKPDFEQKIVSLRRVTRVMAGGRRFSFSAALVIGDRQGRVGFGMGKANETSIALQKAFNQARRNLVKLHLSDTRSVPFETKSKSNASVVELRPNGGRGLVAGSAARIVLDLAGVQHTTARVLTRSRNKMNIARATLDALDMYVSARGAAADIAVVHKPVPYHHE